MQLITFNAADPAGGIGTFQFNPALPSGPDFQITSHLAAPDSLFGLYGGIEGLFRIDTITNSIPVGTDALELATVSSIGTTTFYINDGVSEQLTADLTFAQLSSFGDSLSSIGGLRGTVNLTDIVYTGTNARLLEMASQSGTVTVSFQFDPGQSITSLTTGSGVVDTSSYSGRVTVIPEPSTYAATILALTLGLVTIRRFRERRLA